MLASMASSSPVANVAAPSASAEAPVSRVVQNFVSAWNRNDTAALTSLFTKDASFESPRGARATGRQQIRKLLTDEHSEIYIGTTLVADVTKVTGAATSTPIANGTYTLEGVNVALWFDASVQGSFVFRFAKRGGRWLISSARISKD